ncbi:MAG: hypothetical protein HFI06_08435 [Eubacterium sp.]|nr:hypothetical protein [Eubacterium sp.]
MRRKCCCRSGHFNRCCKYFYRNTFWPDKLKCIRRSFREVCALLNLH